MILIYIDRKFVKFKPNKNIPEGTHQHELMKHAEATLGSGDLRQAVMLPEGEDLNEWVAVNSKLQELTKKTSPLSFKNIFPLKVANCSLMKTKTLFLYFQP